MNPDQPPAPATPPTEPINQVPTPQPQQPYAMPTAPVTIQPTIAQPVQLIAPNPTVQPTVQQPAVQPVNTAPAVPDPVVSAQAQTTTMMPPALASKKPSKRLIITVVGVATAVLVGYFAFSFLSKNVLSGVSLNEYTSEDHKFSIKYPENWETEESNQEYLKDTTFTEELDVSNKSEDNEYYARLFVTKEEATEDYEKYTKDEYFKQYSGRINETDDFTEEKDAGEEYPSNIKVSESTVGGYPAILFEADMNNYYSDDGESGKSRAAFIWVNDSLQYNIDISAHSSDTKFVDKWSEIIGSFKVNQ